MKIAVYNTRQVDAAMGAIACEPNVFPDFRNMSIEFLPVLLIAIMKNGYDNDRSIRKYLAERGCPFEWQVVKFVLNQFEGRQHGKSLWTRYKDGHYAVPFQGRSSFDRSGYDLKMWSHPVT